MRIELEGKESVNKKGETTLKGDASIYGERKENTSLKDLHGREKWEFFKQYYLKLTIIVILAAAVVIYVLVTMLTPKPETVLRVAVANNPLSQELVNKLNTEVTELLVEEEGKQDILIDTNYYLEDSNGMYTLMKLSTLIGAQDLDAMILPYEVFKQQLSGGSLLPVKNVLSASDMVSLKQYLINEIPVEEDLATGEKTTLPADDYGLDFNAYLVSQGYIADEIPTRYVLCIVGNTRHPESCAKFIRYLYK
ncbi:MAG: hypothetical protein ILP10_08385 [Lachnospiraceae bacterium]|nr:hypothetical protein [Lachnospiraceae bacterium]